MGKLIIDGIEFKFNNLYKEEVETDEIEAFMFYENELLTYVEMDMVTVINHRGFYGCSNLNTAIFKNLRVIGDEVFVGCPFKTIDISNVVSIGKKCFWGSEIETISFNDEVIEIPDETFRQCPNLKTIKFSSNLERIGNMAFYRANFIEKMQIPTTVTTIGTEAFYLSGKGEIILPNLINIGEEAFRASYFSKVVMNRITTITKNLFRSSKIITAEFENVEIIEDYAFDYCSEFTQVSIPKIRKIGKYVFASCGKLSFTSLPDTLEEIGAGAFGATLIAIKQLPKKINTLPDFCLSTCFSLTDLILGGKNYPIVSISTSAFLNSTNLTKLTIYTTGGQPLAGAPWGATNATIAYLPA